MTTQASSSGAEHLALNQEDAGSRPASPATLPLFVGEENPYGPDQYYALWPNPRGCAGWRLCHVVLGMEPDAYLEMTGRMNLCVGKWSAQKARVAAGEVLEKATAGDVIIALGAKVAGAFAYHLLRSIEFFSVAAHRGATILALPHPSGRCRVWNDVAAVARARAAVAAVTGLTVGTGGWRG